VEFIACVANDQLLHNDVDASYCVHCRVANNNANSGARSSTKRANDRSAIQPPAKRAFLNDSVHSIAGVTNDVIGTPAELYRQLDEEFHFTHDPCPLIRTPNSDGLLDAWGERNFVNPPYSHTEDWVAKAVSELKNHKRFTVMLIPARVCSYYWKTIWDCAREVRFFEKRIRFAGYKNTFPVPTCLVVFDPAQQPHERKAWPVAGNGEYRTRVLSSQR
jgi:hypothetical protein